LERGRYIKNSLEKSYIYLLEESFHRIGKSSLSGRRMYLGECRKEFCSRKTQIKFKLQRGRSRQITRKRKKIVDVAFDDTARRGGKTRTLVISKGGIKEKRDDCGGRRQVRRYTTYRGSKKERRGNKAMTAAMEKRRKDVF